MEGKDEKEWFNSDYNHFDWFIGFRSPTSEYICYTLGFNLVSEYLKKAS